MLEHKDIVLPEVSLSHDDGDPEYVAAGGPSTPLVNSEGKVYAYRWNGLGPGFWAGYWQANVIERWGEIVAAYEADPDDVYCAWQYIDQHPVFWMFSKRAGAEGVPANHVSRLQHDGAWARCWPEILPHKVNPVTARVDDDKTLNTATEWWYEFGKWDLFEGHAWHDYELDGGELTYEMAVRAIARKIHEHYGNDRRICDAPES